MVGANEAAMVTNAQATAAKNEATWVREESVMMMSFFQYALSWAVSLPNHSVTKT
jgi:hypothetical protein